MCKPWKEELGLERITTTLTLQSTLSTWRSLRESNIRSNERQGLALGVCFTEVFVKRESTVNFGNQTDYSASCTRNA